MQLDFPQGSMRLGDLIRGIRMCKTAADERAYISKEGGMLRTAFRDQDVENRTRNVAKLLYIHMLGYPSQYGQLECLKLVASPKYGDKRIGYLGAQILLDERYDTHLLLTNCIINDLQSVNQFACSLALCTLGNLCSTEMARDLHLVVAGLLSHSNPLIRKKSALCATRIVRKAPELAEIYIPAARKLLQEKLHSDLLTAITLTLQLCHANKTACDYFRAHIVDDMVRLLRKFIGSSFSTDFDVLGINDPFLQVKLVSLLGLLGENDDLASEQMQDVLAMAATNTDSSKNVGNAILYETVRAILRIKATPTLRILAINILGKLLVQHDTTNNSTATPAGSASQPGPASSNYRCVALQMLQDCALSESKAVQKHRNTVLDCLKDPDVTIRKRAYELSFYLINSANIEVMMLEILRFLEHADTEMKSFICSEVILACQRFAPSMAWLADTILTLVSLAGAQLSSSDVTAIVNMFTAMFYTNHTDPANPINSFIKSVVRNFYAALTKDIYNQPLVQITVWFVGDTCDASMVQTDPLFSHLASLMETILNAGTTSDKSKRFVMASLVKLSARHCLPGTDVARMLVPFSGALAREIQQRALEYIQIIHTTPESAATLFAPSKLSPLVYEKYAVHTTQLTHQHISDHTDNTTSITSDAHPVPADLLATGASNLLNLLDLNEHSVRPTNINNNALSTAPSISKQIYDKNGLCVEYTVEYPMPGSKCNVFLHFSTINSQFTSEASDFQLLAAVPKSYKLQLTPASNSSVPPNNSTNPVTQTIKIAAPETTKLIKLRLKINYTLNSTTHSDQIELSI